MFQYAAGRALACQRETVLKLDASRLQLDPLREYRLGVFNLIENFATENEIKNIAPRRRQYLPWLRKQAARFLRPNYADPVIDESAGGMIGVDGKNDIYLIGYWQSERYFASVDRTIRQEFTLKDSPDERNQELLAKIEVADSVNLHVRRGDYVSNPKTNQFHGVLGLEYYQNAVELIAERVAAPHFFVFSDDIPWAKDNLQLPFPMTFVGHNGRTHDFEDLRLMSHCKHHIIANSSFSWWGAWLSDNSNKVVIAPRRWFASEDLTRKADSELVPERWLRL